MFAAPLLVAIALAQQPSLFLFVGVAGALSDASDGTIARWLNSASARGAALDSRADVLFYCATIAGLAMLFPARIVSEWQLATTVVLAYAMPIAFGYRKFGRITSYHTWLARVALATLTPGIVGWLWFNSTPLMFAGTAVLVLSAIEEIVITHILQAPRDNVPHVFHLLLTKPQRRER